MKNKAVMENGDYKTIAHISESGRIKWYIENPKSYVPAESMEVIKGWAESAHKKFMDKWANLPDLRKYEILLDEMPFDYLLDHPLKEKMKACTDLHEKVLMLQKIYFEDYLREVKRYEEI